MPRREASEPLGNESAMNVFSTSLRDHSYQKERPLKNTPLTKMDALQVVRTSFLGPRPFFYPPPGFSVITDASSKQKMTHMV